MKPPRHRRLAARTSLLLFMVVERFRHGQGPAVYRRFRERGGKAPEGLLHLSSWMDLGLRRCFHVVQAEDEALLTEWMAGWENPSAFEIVPVQASADAADAMASELRWPAEP